jgi:hypothetical protein
MNSQDLQNLQEAYVEVYEGAAAEHPDIANQSEFQKKADEVLKQRQKKRAKKVSPELPSFVKRLKKEEFELDERYKPLPIDKMTNKIEAKRKINRMPPTISMHRPFVQSLGDVIRKSDNIDKITKTINTHDPLESRFKELENKDRGEKKSKTKLEKDYKLSSDGKYRRRSKVKEEVELDEKIDVGADAGATISDFVHSKSKTFKGDSKKQRINRALGAYYAAKKAKVNEANMPGEEAPTPTSTPEPTTDKNKNQQLNNLKVMQQKQRQLQQQRFNLQKQGKLPINAN